MKDSEKAGSDEMTAKTAVSQYERLFETALRHDQLDIAEDIVLKLNDLLGKAISRTNNTRQEKFGSKRQVFESIIDTRYNHGALHSRLMQIAITHNVNRVKELIIRSLSNFVQTQFMFDKYEDEFMDELLSIHALRINKIIIDSRDFETFRTEINFITKSGLPDPSHVADDIARKLDFSILNSTEIDEKAENLRFMIKYECVKDFRLFDEFLTQLFEYEQIILKNVQDETQKESINADLREIEKMTKQLKILSKLHFAFFQIGIYLFFKGTDFNHFIEELWYDAISTDDMIVDLNKPPVTDDVIWLTLNAIYGGSGSSDWSEWSEFFEFDESKRLKPYVFQYYCLLLLKMNKIPSLPSNSELVEWNKRNEKNKLDFWYEFARHVNPEDLSNVVDTLWRERKTQIIRRQLNEEIITNIRSELERLHTRTKDLEDELVKLHPVVYNKLEECRKKIESAYAQRSKAKLVAQVQFSSEGKNDDYREIPKEKPLLPRDNFTDRVNIYTDLSWSKLGAWIADEETKLFISYLRQHISLESRESSDLLTKVKESIRILKDRGYHPNAMFISRDGKSEIGKEDPTLFLEHRDKAIINGEEINVIMSPKEFALNEILIFSSQALEVIYASKGPSNPLSIDFKNTEIGNDKIIIDCRIMMKVIIKDSKAFTRFK